MRVPTAALIVLLALPAHAGEAWETYNLPDGRGAGICPVDDENRYFCFLISCAPEGGPLWMRVAFSGDHALPETPVLRISIDGGPESTRRLSALPAEDQDFGIRYDDARDADLLEALAAGSRATLTLGNPPGTLSQDMPLSGSRRAIESLAHLCGT